MPFPSGLPSTHIWSKSSEVTVLDHDGSVVDDGVGGVGGGVEGDGMSVSFVVDVSVVDTSVVVLLSLPLPLSIPLSPP